jgi:alpha-mannosidase
MQRNPLPQLVPQRIATLRKDIDALQWASTTALRVEGGPVNRSFVDLAGADEQRFTAVQPGSWFARPSAKVTGSAHVQPGNQWCNRWFRLAIPAATKAERGRRHLVWRCDGETTAWIDGQPWAGLECAHASCPLPDHACTVWLDTGCYATGIWAPGWKRIGSDGLRFEGASLAVRDQAAWDASCDLEMLDDLLNHLLAQAGLKGSGGFGHQPAHERLAPLARMLLTGLESAADAYVTGGLPALSARLAGLRSRLRGAGGWQPVNALAGHAHIDLVWLWPESATERKGIHTFATVLRLMERYPEFRFSQSQPALYRAIERLAPGQAAEVRTAIKRGQWEAMGGFEVEPDNHLPCGEALARSLRLGQAKLAELTGRPSRLCWIPDVFGYAACLPQILRLGGVDSFYTTKMTWSTVTRFPYTSFVWRGNDGSEVLTHLAPCGYNGDVKVGDLAKAMDEHRQLGVHDELLTCHGFGDGGGGPTERMCERARRLADLAGTPPARWSATEPFFDRLAKVRDKLPVYQGELYLEYHRGTYTTQSDFKAAYRGAERALQIHEAVRAAQGMPPLAEDDWRRVAFAQFHDAIPGSSIAQVYADLTPELTDIADRHLAAARAALAGAGPGWTVFNPLAIARTAVVELPATAGPLADETGSPIAMQTHGTGKARRTLALVTVPPLGSVSLVPAASATTEPPTPRSAGSHHLDNGLVQAAFDKTGNLAGMTVDGRPLRLAGPAHFAIYHDKAANFDAWDIDHYVLAHPQRLPAMPLRLVEHGPVRSVLAGQVAFGQRSTLSVRWILDAGSRWLRCEAAVAWQEDHRLLKFHAPTGYRGRMARFGCPFGSVQRPQQPGVAADEAMWEVPGQRWAAVTDEDGTGLAIVSEAKYGFSCKDGDLGLSLLRAPGDPDPRADRGDHVLRFAVGRHESHSAVTAGTPADLYATAAAADALFTPPVVAPGRRRTRAGDDRGHGPFRLRNLGSLVPSWVEPLRNGYVIRLHETNGASGSATVQLDHPARGVDLIDFVGTVIGRAAPLGGDAWRIDYRPYQIISVRVRS